MSVQIRLSRHGSKKQPFYRIVVADKRAPRDGRFLERIGVFNPTAKPEAFEIDSARFEYWTGKGAQPSDTVAQLVKKYAKIAAASSDAACA